MAVMRPRRIPPFLFSIGPLYYQVESFGELFESQPVITNSIEMCKKVPIRSYLNVYEIIIDHEQ